MEWWIKKIHENSTSTPTHAVLQSGQLTIIAELTPCGRRLQEGDKLTPLANALYCINGDKSITIKVLNATHFSAERWGAIVNITAH
ncbi:histidine kinase [Klebsiella grimontii]|jgi:signal transduction protein PmrD|uniref:Histidine kinase n=1 Tax=Klebsiella grimontii TaxID=2058152 RepID=A0A839CPE1_9ENTR|nr:MULTISPECIES: signal transduction protein PmrD [Klebsiella]EKP27051.1 signal transduction protein PmrD [Klebsiella michiganensis]BAS41625.1 polymyxin resistance protein B [Klebsiella oxytoca]ARI09407.1 histidine kinase [Klebsiella sp. M5al]KZT46580.1 histidine kinase [Klebsiella michiganensis]MBA8005785.1 histidine kinase [Klebsiella grimontii]